MTQTIQNGITSLENLLAVNTFRIPQYQRAYSWDAVPHLDAFLDDLRQQVKAQAKGPDKHYFLGTFLLHEEDIGSGRRVVNIVDGQQRMTTSVVFMASALAQQKASKIALANENPALLRRTFVRDEDARQQKFHTIQEDEPFFQSAILGISDAPCNEDSPSARRLKAAADFFAKEVKPSEWEPLIEALRTAKVMVYSVGSAEDATQIFELQNDRGKPLTNLEALKSFLMHCVYLHSSTHADDHLATLQTQFSKIFRTVESLAELKRTPGEDQLLTNHCTAFLAWSEKEFANPKQLVKDIIQKMSDSSTVIPWIEKFVGSLVESYRAIHDMFLRRDELIAFSELLLLGRTAPLWPLIVKAWRHDRSPTRSDFLMTCRLLEVFTFRAFAIGNLRSDTSLSRFQTMARDFEGNFASLFKDLCGMSHLYELNRRFVDGLSDRDLYRAGDGDLIYLLWRYENHLRGQKGKQQPPLSWRDLVEPKSYAAKFSVEHVAAQDHPIVDTMVVWGEYDPEPFRAIALNRLGNLVLDSISTNASKGKRDFAGKLKSLSENSIYLSQGELITFVSDRDNPVWDVDAVLARQKHLIGFMMETWNPNTWHS